MIFCNPSRVLVGHHWRKSGMWVCTLAGSPRPLSTLLHPWCSKTRRLQRHSFFMLHYKPAYFFSLFWPWGVSVIPVSWLVETCHRGSNGFSGARCPGARQTVTFWVTAEPKSRGRDAGADERLRLQGGRCHSVLLRNRHIDHYLWWSYTGG